MKSISEIKAEKEIKVGEVIENSLMFFAFSNEQFDKNKTELQPGEKYVSIGAGAYLPKSKVDVYLLGMENVDKWYKSAIRANKVRKENIAYELANHEAYYTGEIEDTLKALGSDYTEEEVRKVFRAERKKQNQIA